MAAAEDREDDEGELPGVRTDPPPPGEEDPYGAATRVGPMSPVAIAKMMRESEVPASSGLRSSLQSATPAPAPAPAPVVAAKEATSKAEEEPPPEPPVASPLEVPPTTSGPPRPAFPEWIATRDAEERLNAEQRLRLLHRAAAVALLLFAAMTGLIIWLLTR